MQNNQEHVSDEPIEYLPFEFLEAKKFRNQPNCNSLIKFYYFAIDNMVFPLSTYVILTRS